MLTLGFNLGHDQGAALISDGRIVCAISQERLDRIKHSSGVNVPHLAIDYCLKSSGVSWKDLDVVVYNYPHHTNAYDRIDAVELEVQELWGQKPVFVPHHLSHAYAAFYASPFKEANVIVADGAGNLVAGRLEKFYAQNGWPINGGPEDIEAESGFYFTGEQIKPLFARYQTRYGYNQVLSLGRMYWETCLQVGMGILDGGKLMGLAPYGKDGSPVDRIALDGPDFKISKDLITALPKGTFEKNARAAYIIQKNLEQMLLLLAEYCYSLSPCPNLCMSGGIALNAISNRQIINQSKHQNLFIVPPCNDSGIPLGCAYYGYYGVLKGAERAPYTQYTGKKYGEDVIRAAIGGFLHRKCDDIADEVAELLEQGRVVGWFQGKSEYGPRALGNRSILCDPRRAKMKDRLNNKVKHRENYRPFAPSVPLEHASKYFKMPCKDSPFMLLILEVFEKQKPYLPAITHVDGTARIQTVRREDNPRYYRLLTAFGKRTGVYVLLNTSFNIAGEPIVETPQDAVCCFLNTQIDYLAIGNYLVWK